MIYRRKRIKTATCNRNKHKIIGYAKQIKHKKQWTWNMLTYHKKIHIMLIINVLYIKSKNYV